MREQLEEAQKRVGELQETGALFKEQQVAAVQAAAGAQKQVFIRFLIPLAALQAFARRAGI